MTYALQWIRSLIFNACVYIAMGVLGFIFAIPAIFSRRAAILACHLFCDWVTWSAGWMIGLRCEVRGEPPQDECLIAAKHQSFLDVIMIYGAVPRGKFIMKDILKYAPIIGQFALRIGCIPVQRGKRGLAIKKMVADVDAGRALPGQLIIYSQGTRVAPGVKVPYKVGSGVLYQELGQDCVPVATNAGVYWPKRGVYRAPGVAVVDFLPRIAAGMPLKPFMAQLEEMVETRSDALIHDAEHRVLSHEND